MSKNPLFERIEYYNPNFDPAKISSDPFTLFHEWFKLAVQQNISEPNAMSLSTVSIDNKPSSRMVLLKFYDKNGFVFFTNYDSRKGKEISNNSNVSLLFFWEKLFRQVRIEGNATKTTKTFSNEYFNSRPVKSKIYSIISPQSKIIQSKEFLNDQFIFYLKNQDKIKRPDNWGGYLVKPTKFEFWVGQKSRFHDRIIYIKKNKLNWTKHILAP